MKKFKIGTGLHLPNGDEVMLGDIIKSNQTQDVVVILKDSLTPIVQVIRYPDMYFLLSDFLDEWEHSNSIYVSNNILIFEHQNK